MSVSSAPLQVPERGSATSLLEVRNLAVAIRTEDHDQLRILKGIDLHINAGETIGLLGESGAGKTTLAMAIMGLLPRAEYLVEGSIRFDRVNLLSLKESELRRIRGAQVSLVHQDSAVLTPVLRVGEQIVEVLRAHRKWSRQQYRDKAISLLEDLEIADPERIYTAYPYQLSGGQRQRIGLAQALACDPALLIADEPTSSLDAGAAADFLNLLKRAKLRFSIAVLLISHNSSVLATVSDRIMVMYAGRIVEQGVWSEVLRTPHHPYTRALLECGPQFMSMDSPHPVNYRMSTIAGRSPDLSRSCFGCDFSNRCPDELELCRSRVPEEMRISNSHSARCFKIGG